MAMADELYSNQAKMIESLKKRLEETQLELDSANLELFSLKEQLQSE
jgi:hypothetical protein